MEKYRTLIQESLFRIVSSKEDKANSKMMQSLDVQKLPSRSRGDKQTSFQVALKAAVKYNKSCYVYVGDSYNHKVYQTTFKKNDALNTINNSFGLLIEITPDRKFIVHELER